MRQVEQMARCYEKLILVITIFIAVAPVTAAYATDPRHLEIAGWVENVTLVEPGITLSAKLDSGAETSSLDVMVVKKFRKNDRRWVRFRLKDPATGRQYTLVRERVRTVSIIQHDGGRIHRPVVAMDLCIAGRLVTTEIGLADRSEFTYPLLLGRNTLGGIVVIDPHNTNLTEPDCNPASATEGAHH